MHGRTPSPTPRRRSHEGSFRSPSARCSSAGWDIHSGHSERKSGRVRLFPPGSCAREKSPRRGRETRLEHLSPIIGGRLGKGRLEAFSDGVIAVIITIMVLDLKAPHGESFEALVPLIPRCSSAMSLSFIYVGIYWNNHHHMLHACDRVTGAILWANLHLLFWLSLIPFTTAWMGENHFAPAPRRSMAWCC